MTTTLQNYQNAVRELERANHNGDRAAIRAAEDNYDDARTKWDAERDALVDDARKHSTPSAPAETEAEYVKRCIKNVRYALATARQENKILYRQLQENRTTKRELNKQYDILRTQKNTLKKVNT